MKTIATVSFIAWMVVVGIIVLTTIEIAQLDRHCAQWGWTYCIPKGESVHSKNNPISYRGGWDI